MSTLVTESSLVWKSLQEKKSTNWTIFFYYLQCVDAGFPQGGRQLSRGGGRQHTILANFPILAIFPKNWLKLKEFGPGEGVLRAPLDPSMISYVYLSKF